MNSAECVTPVSIATSEKHPMNMEASVQVESLLQLAFQVPRSCGARFSVPYRYSCRHAGSPTELNSPRKTNRRAVEGAARKVS